MERRITRSVAAREGALLAAKSDVKPELITQPPRKRKGPTTTSKSGPAKKRKSLSETTANAESVSRNQTTEKAIPIVSIVNELPHNLGPAPTSADSKNDSLKVESGEKSDIKETELEQVANDIQKTVDKTTETLQEPAGKKTTKKHPYGLTPGFSPFPEWDRPTPEECEEVNKLLSSVHGQVSPPKSIPEPSLTVTGCGEVPSVLDALIRTLLSGATTGKNSAMAFNGLVQKFGILEEGVGKGSVNWDAVRRAPLKDVFEAIKRGGLADIKSKNLKGILDMVHKENRERKSLLLDEEKRLSDLPNQSEGTKQYEVACADQNFLSLNHLHSLTKEEAMINLVKYPGIGPKTAACVILFCLQRPCFAVDTHVFRLCKWLGWIPPNKATEVSAFSHLEVRIPDHLKYSLHQLFIFHGKSCPRCRAITGQSSAGWDDGCVIDHLVTRSGKRKAARPKPKKTSRESVEDDTEDE